MPLWNNNFLHITTWSKNTIYKIVMICFIVIYGSLQNNVLYFRSYIYNDKVKIIHDKFEYYELFLLNSF